MLVVIKIVMITKISYQLEVTIIIIIIIQVKLSFRNEKV
jgi:hypothetical protein